MTYRVVLQDRAQKDIDDALAYIAAHDSTEAALKWYEGLIDAMESLATMPTRCRLAPEASRATGEVRQLIYHSHRILFDIEARAVRILHIRHGGRLPAQAEDLNAD